MPNNNEDTNNKSADAMRSLVGLSRMLVPMAESYGRSKAAEAARRAACEPEKSDVCEPPAKIRRGEPGELSADERRAFGMAFARLMAESGELLTGDGLTDERGVPRSVSFDQETGEYPAPSLAFALSALRNISQPNEQQTRAMKMEAPPPQESFAMRSMSSPMMMSMPVNEVRSQALARPPYPPQLSRPSRSTPVPQRAAGCACAHPKPQGACCGAGAGSHATSAMRNAEGKCEPNPFEISCETQIRLKQCLKLVLCEFLRCLERRLCLNGQFQWDLTAEALIDCLGEAICTLLRCIPEALCPPEESEDCCATPAVPQSCLPCNFAVEEK